MESLVIPIVACTCDMEDSKLAAVVTDAVPSAVTPAVTGRSFCPAEEMLSPTVFSFSPDDAIFCTAVADWFACVSRFFKSCSVSTISL